MDEVCECLTLMFTLTLMLILNLALALRPGVRLQLRLPGAVGDVLARAAAEQT